MPCSGNFLQENSISTLQIMKTAMIMITLHDNHNIDDDECNGNDRQRLKLLHKGWKDNNENKDRSHSKTMTI